MTKRGRNTQPRVFRGTVIQTAPSGARHDVNITLTDLTSSTRVVEIRMSTEEFGHMLRAPMDTPCEFALYENEHVGMVLETDQWPVELPDRFLSPGDHEAVDAVLAPYEFDGWIGRRGDVTNPHRISRGEGDKRMAVVSFHRWVPNVAPEKNKGTP